MLIYKKLLSILLLGYYKYNIKTKVIKIVLFSKNNKSMKKILILGAGEYQVPLISTAKKQKSTYNSCKSKRKLPGLKIILNLFF